MDSLHRIAVSVNGAEVLLLTGMTVGHALVAAGLWQERGRLAVYDAWGNELGLDGAVCDGMKIVAALHLTEE